MGHRRETLYGGNNPQSISGKSMCGTTMGKLDYELFCRVHGAVFFGYRGLWTVFFVWGADDVFGFGFGQVDA